jgi:hypothetical protein
LTKEGELSFGQVMPTAMSPRQNALWPGKSFAAQKNKDIGTQNINICLLLKLVHKLHSADSSAWAQWVKSRACIATLKGDLHGEHWDVLRSILPLYQAITTVSIGNGEQTSFWKDVWLGDDALADRFPILFSHCTQKEMSVKAVMDTDLTQTLVPRLTNGPQYNYRTYRHCCLMSRSLTSLINGFPSLLTAMEN